MTLTATSFDWVRALVHKESAIVLQPGKEYLVEARLLPIARQLGIADVSQYVESVRSRPSADSTTPIRIDSRISLTTTATGGPPKKRLRLLFMRISRGEQLAHGWFYLSPLAG